jgi:hypothetical protein
MLFAGLALSRSPQNSLVVFMSRSSTLLCVSEDLYGLHEIVTSLQNAGHKVICACSYSRALALVALEEVEAIVLCEPKLQPLFSPPSSLKFIRPEIPILLVTFTRLAGKELPAGVDRVTCSTTDILGDIDVLLEQRSSIPRLVS